MITNKEAFTLVELSIVIVIVALIIAGVAAGSALVQQFKLRTVIADKDMYFSAMRAFEMQYGGMAGDIKNAQSYWGTTDSSGNSIDNGNSNGKIIGATEGLQAWLHFKLAKLVNNGNYTGTTTYTNITPGYDIGVSGYSNSVGFNWFSLGTGNNGWGFGITTIYGLFGNTVLTIGRIVESPPAIQAGAAFTGRAAYAFDKKFDDGIPNTGAIMADTGTAGSSCLNPSVGAGTAERGDIINYRQNNSVSCRIMFLYK